MMMNVLTILPLFIGTTELLLIGGMADFNSKIFESLGAAELDGLFLFYTFMVAFIIRVGLFLRGRRCSSA